MHFAIILHQLVDIAIKFTFVMKKWEMFNVILMYKTEWGKKIEVNHPKEEGESNSNSFAVLYFCLMVGMTLFD